MTLPFEPGYRVYVNGEKYKYDSYRGALMLLHLNAGNNDFIGKVITNKKERKMAKNN